MGTVQGHGRWEKSPGKGAGGGEGNSYGTVR